MPRAFLVKRAKLMSEECFQTNTVTSLGGEEECGREESNEYNVKMRNNPHDTNSKQLDMTLNMMARFSTVTHNVQITNSSTDPVYKQPLSEQYVAPNHFLSACPSSFLPSFYRVQFPSQFSLLCHHQPQTNTQQTCQPDVIIPSPPGNTRQRLTFSDTSDEHSSSSFPSHSNKGQSTRIFFPSEIRKAQELVAEDFKKHQCQVCLKWFKRASSLSNHRLIHKNSKSFKCEHCGMCFLRKSDLGKHTVIHSGSKPYACATCGKRFSQSSNMLTHQRRHSGVRPYSCSCCGKSFYRKVDVRRHSSVHREF